MVLSGFLKDFVNNGSIPAKGLQPIFNSDQTRSYHEFRGPIVAWRSTGDLDMNDYRKLVHVFRTFRTTLRPADEVSVKAFALFALATR